MKNLTELINDYNNAKGVDRIFFLSRINAYVANRELSNSDGLLYREFMKTFN